MKLAYRLPEAVEISGIGRTKLYELIAQGEIEVAHVGRRVLVPHESLERYLRAQTVLNKPAAD